MTRPGPGEEADGGRSAEQEEFGAALHEMLSGAATAPAARRWAAGDPGPGLRLWAGLARLGVTALAVPEDAGGAGASPLDLVVACEELGHHAVPGPVAESLAAVPCLLAALDAVPGPPAAPHAAPGPPAASHAASAPPAPPHAAPGPPAPPHAAPGPPAARDAVPGPSAAPHAAPAPPATPYAADGPPAAPYAADGGGTPPGSRGRWAGWLAGLAAGDLIATLALPPRVPYALDADVAGLVLLAAEDTVWLGTPGSPAASVDGTRRLCTVRAGARLARSPAVADAIARAEAAGTLASAAQLLGAGRALLEASVRHARLRVQFGRPVGTFQAVKHRLADVAIALEFARPLLDAAAAAFGGHRATAARDISAARVACADAAYRAARAALQVHGAVGYTAEHDLSLWLAKVTALRSAWGTQAHHRATVLASLTTAAATPSATSAVTPPATIAPVAAPPATSAATPPATPGPVPTPPATPGLVSAPPATPGPVPASPATSGPVPAPPATPGPVPAPPATSAATPPATSAPVPTPPATSAATPGPVPTPSRSATSHRSVSCHRPAAGESR